MLSCEHCYFHQVAAFDAEGYCQHPKIKNQRDQGYGYCSVERRNFGNATSCGPHGKLFEPAPEHVLQYHISEEYLFAKNPLAFWLDPERWDNLNPNLRDPDGEAFWMS